MVSRHKQSVTNQQDECTEHPVHILAVAFPCQTLLKVDNEAEQLNKHSL